MSDNHCKDCCCARSWKALGITEYTGKSIPEHIAELTAQLEEARRVMQGIVDHCIHPDIAVRAVMVDLKPIRAFLANVPNCNSIQVAKPFVKIIHDVGFEPQLINLNGRWYQNLGIEVLTQMDKQFALAALQPERKEGE